MLKSKPMYFLYWVIAGIFIFLFIFLLVKLFPFYRAVFSFMGHLLAPFIGACLIVYFLYWVIVVIFIFLFIVLLVKLFPFYRSVFSFIGQLLAPFIVACLIAYLLYPIIKKIHHYNVPKSIAILMIYLLFFGGGAYLM